MEFGTFLRLENQKLALQLGAFSVFSERDRYTPCLAVLETAVLGCETPLPIKNKLGKKAKNNNQEGSQISF